MSFLNPSNWYAPSFSILLSENLISSFPLLWIMSQNQSIGVRVGVKICISVCPADVFPNSIKHFNIN